MVVTPPFQVWGLETVFHLSPTGRGTISGKGENVNYESDTEDDTKNGTAGLWIIVGITRAR